MGCKEQGCEKIQSSGQQLYMELSMVGSDDGMDKDKSSSSLMSRKMDKSKKVKQEGAVMTTGR
jgi:hypothetical protein